LKSAFCPKYSIVVRNIPPHIHTAILSQAFIVEAVYGRDLPRLMVAADECDSVGVSYFEAEKEEERLERVEATINKITYASISVAPS
jgi:hypothetical protein